MDLAYRDALTQLPNRALFNDRLDAALAAAAAHAQPGGGAADGPRPLQGRQRHAGSFDRRPHPARRRAAHRFGADAHHRHRRAPRRRRVRDPAARRRRHACRARRALDPARARAAGDARGPRRRRAREHRHRRLPRAWRRARDADAPRRHRDVRGEARQSRPRGMGPPARRARQGPAVADEWLAQGRRRGRAGAAVPADRHDRRRARAARRVAGALVAPDARPRGARGIHPVRRADRLHPCDHAVGDGARRSRSARRGAATAWR